MPAEAIDNQGIPTCAHCGHQNIVMQAKYPQPLELSGTLDRFESFKSTPCIGTEFPKADLAQWLRAPDSDQIIRDLAITIAQRGVVFFRGQTSLDKDLHKELIQRLGLLSGKPKENGLYKHPLCQLYKDEDPEYTPLDGGRLQNMYGKAMMAEKRQSARVAWHSDDTWEQNPPDFSSLRLTKLPQMGGDTLWASGYEVYDRLSEPYQRFFESLTATAGQQKLNIAANARGQTVYQGPRGSPANIGGDMTAVHPVIRTHPVTGWKSLFAVGMNVEKINGVTAKESEQLLDKIMHLILENHDLQVRFRWENPSDMAIWDNRCVYHAPTPDPVGPRDGWRVISIAEKPYLDPNSKSRAQALAEQASKPPKEAETDKGVDVKNGVNGNKAQLLNGTTPTNLMDEKSGMVVDVMEAHRTSIC